MPPFVQLYLSGAFVAFCCTLNAEIKHDNVTINLAKNMILKLLFIFLSIYWTMYFSTTYKNVDHLMLKNPTVQ